MKTPISMHFKIPIIVLLLSVLTFGLNAQDDYKKAMEEMREAFGTVPAFFEVFPKHAVPGVWEYFQQLNSPQGELPPKYRELIQLSVASQIPCEYCVYFHTAAAKVYGATKGELREAIAHGAATRHWSMILQGNQIELPAFKKEVDMMFEYMAENSK